MQLKKLIMVPIDKNVNAAALRIFDTITTFSVLGEDDLNRSPWTTNISREEMTKMHSLVTKRMSFCCSLSLKKTDKKLLINPTGFLHSRNCRIVAAALLASISSNRLMAVFASAFCLLFFRRMLRPAFSIAVTDAPLVASDERNAVAARPST